MDKKQEIEYVERKLTEEDIKKKRIQFDSMKLQNEANGLQIEQLKKRLETKFDERDAKLRLRELQRQIDSGEINKSVEVKIKELESSIELNNRNIKVIEKQIREKIERFPKTRDLNLNGGKDGKG